MTEENEYLPADRGMTGLGLIMQLAGSLFGTMTAMVGLMQIIMFSQMRDYGGEGGPTGWLFLLTCAGVIRSLVHRNAGSELLYGHAPARALRGYFAISAIHTALWFLFFKMKLEAPTAGWMPMVLMFAAWPLTLWLALRIPALRLVDGEPLKSGPDRGFEGLSILMIVLGLMGTLFAATMLMAFSSQKGGPGDMKTLFMLCLFALVVRSLVHTHAGAQMLGDLTFERAEAATTRYINLGMMVGLGVGAVFLIMIMKEPGGGMLLAFPFIGGMFLLLLAWPMIVRRLTQTRRLEAYGDGNGEPRLSRAPDQGRTTLGWLHLALGGMALAGALPAIMFSQRIDMSDDDALGGGLLGFMQQDPGRAPWLAVIVAGLQLWAGLELVRMTARHKTIATVYGVAAGVAALYIYWPILKHLDDMRGIMPGAGQMIVAGLAIALIVPIVTIALVQRPLPPPRLGASVGRVFE
jgi:hypothetical protein